MIVDLLEAPIKIWLVPESTALFVPIAIFPVCVVWVPMFIAVPPLMLVVPVVEPIEMDPPFKLAPMDMLDVIEAPLIVSAFSIPTFAVPNV
jgi:hypothetical protein